MSVRKSAKKAASNKVAANKVVAKEVAANKAVAKKVVPTKVVAKKTVSKKVVSTKVVAEKTVAKKVVANEVDANKVVAKPVAKKRSDAKGALPKVAAIRATAKQATAKKATSPVTSHEMSAKAVSKHKAVAKEPSSASAKLASPKKSSSMAAQAKKPVFTLDQARRIALAAQGFAEPRPTARVDRRHIRKVFDRIGLLQVDSVNVLARSEELPIFARLGPHARDLVRTMEADGELFEYWAHEASLLPVAHEPLFRWKKEEVRNGERWAWNSLVEMRQKQPEFLARVLQEVSDRGPIAASELSMRVGQVGDHWGWRWDDAKRAIETLFWGGEVAGRRRIVGFEREYDLPERRFPAEVLQRPTLSAHEARLALLRVAAQSVGIGSMRDIADYHRLHLPSTRPLIQELVDSGELIEVSVPGWSENLLMWPNATIPRRIEARALISPFDSLIWERTRTEDLFGFRYRIEIYVPQLKRQYGYYVLPFLLGDELVARVDLKSDRKAGSLLVQASWGELGIDETHVANELADELRLMAAWLGLERVEVKPKGDLARALGKAVKAKPA